MKAQRNYDYDVVVKQLCAASTKTYSPVAPTEIVPSISACHRLRTSAMALW